MGYGPSEESCKDYLDRSGQFVQKNPSERVFIFYKPVSYRDGNQKPSLQALFTPKEVARLHPTIVSVTLFFYRTIYQSSQHLLPSRRSCFLQQQTQKATCFACRTSVIPRSSQQSGGGKKELQRRYCTTLTRKLESEQAKNSKRGQFQQVH